MGLSCFKCESSQHDYLQNDPSLRDPLQYDPLCYNSLRKRSKKSTINDDDVKILPLPMIKKIDDVEKNISLTYDIDSCPICLDDLIKTSDTYYLECGHEYHKECINEWLMKSSTQKCPYCGHIIKAEL